MPLNFPNASRSYEPRKQCVSFWGYDSTMEIAFEVDDEALHALCPTAERNESSLLGAFDVNRDRIEKAAIKAYGKGGQFYIRLSSKDF